MAKSGTWSHHNRACFSGTEDKTGSRETHKQATTEGGSNTKQSISRQAMQDVVMSMPFYINSHYGGGQWMKQNYKKKSSLSNKLWTYVE